MICFWLGSLTAELYVFYLYFSGNSLCLAAICSAKSLMARPTKVYMTVILLMCDIHLTATLITWLPTSFVDYVNLPQTDVLQSTILTDLGCQLLDYFRSASLFVLAWLLVAQTGERYVTLARPFRKIKNPTRIACLISFAVFLIGFGVEATKFFGIVVRVTNGTIATEPPHCGLNDLGAVVQMVDVLIIYLLSPIFLFVLGLCLTCMVSMHNSLRKKWRYRKANLLVDEHHSGLSLTVAYAYSLALFPFFIWSVLFLISMIWGEDNIIDYIALYVKEGAELLLALLTSLNVLYFIIAGKRHRAVICRIMCGCFYKDSQQSLCSEEDSMRSPSMSHGVASDFANGHTPGKADDHSAGASMGQINMVFQEDLNNSEMTQL